jgi:hypothetical protein
MLIAYFRKYVLCLIPLIFLPLAATAADDNTVALDLLLSDVQSALIKVRGATEDESLPPLSRVKLTLQTTLIDKGDGKLELAIVEVGGSLSSERSQELTIELEPPHVEDKSPVSSSSDSLADAIIAAARSIKAAASRDPPLHLVKLTSSIQFVVQKDAAFGVGFKILPVTANIKGDFKRKSVQTAVIEYGG